jgi:myo-inositol-1(or 4)-monophosphatase
MGSKNRFVEEALSAITTILERVKEGNRELRQESGERGAGGDISLAGDLWMEELFISHLSKFGPIWTEERGEVGGGAGGKIVIDPLDGSFNFKIGLPYYGCAIFWEEGVGIVVNLANGDLFLRVEDEVKSLNLLGLAIPRFPPLPSEGVLFEKAYQNWPLVKRLQEEGVKFRSPGALSLSLCYGAGMEGVVFTGPVREFDYMAPYYITAQFTHWTVDKENGIIVSAPTPQKREWLYQLAISSKG